MEICVNFWYICKSVTVSYFYSIYDSKDEVCVKFWYICKSVTVSDIFYSIYDSKDGDLCKFLIYM